MVGSHRCPFCDTMTAKTLGGGTHGCYRMLCLVFEGRWQIRRSDSEVVSFSYNPKNAKPTGNKHSFSFASYLPNKSIDKHLKQSTEELKHSKVVNATKIT